MIAAAADERLSETLLFAAADIGIALAPVSSPRRSLTGIADVRRFACRALAAVAFERGAGALIPLLDGSRRGHPAWRSASVSRLHHTEAIAADRWTA